MSTLQGVAGCLNGIGSQVVSPQLSLNRRGGGTYASGGSARPRSSPFPGPAGTTPRIGPTAHHPAHHRASAILRLVPSSALAARVPCTAGLLWRRENAHTIRMHTRLRTPLPLAPSSVFFSPLPPPAFPGPSSPVFPGTYHEEDGARLRPRGFLRPIRTSRAVGHEQRSMDQHTSGCNGLTAESLAIDIRVGSARLECSNDCEQPCPSQSSSPQACFFLHARD